VKQTRKGEKGVGGARKAEKRGRKHSVSGDFSDMPERNVRNSILSRGLKKRMNGRKPGKKKKGGAKGGEDETQTPLYAAKGGETNKPRDRNESPARGGGPATKKVRGGGGGRVSPHYDPGEGGVNTRWGGPLESNELVG